MSEPSVTHPDQGPGPAQPDSPQPKPTQPKPYPPPSPQSPSQPHEDIPEDAGENRTDGIPNEDDAHAPPVTGDIVVDAALRDLAAAQTEDLDAQIETGESLQRTLQGRLSDLGG